MLIDKIEIRNFRIYEGHNCLDFTHHSDKNITIISGSNGYGKTSFLTALVWCLYGKLMADVDERYKKEIYDSGGYKRFCEKVTNRALIGQYDKQRSILKEQLKESSSFEKANIEKELLDISSFSVSILISDIFIPSVPCNKVEICRTYHIEKHKEELKILIDGRENELTKEVGPEIFVNDFILPKEIAKFFFFDAEKIVSLAEIRSADEKRELSRAYSEVLGIKKYEDLKSNLENIRTRLKKESASQQEKEKFEEINRSIQEKQKLLKYYDERLEEISEDLSRKKMDSDRYQEKLIREGSSITTEELNDLKKLQETTSNEARNARKRLKELLELAPFAIASKKMRAVEKQLDDEAHLRNNEVSKTFIRERLESIKKAVNESKTINLTETDKKEIVHILEDQLLTEVQEKYNPILEFSEEDRNYFKATTNNLFNSYQKRFRALVNDVKMNQSAFSIINSKITDAETKENDLVIQEIRKAKVRVDQEVSILEQEVIDLKAKGIAANHELNNLLRIHSELEKKISVANVDLKKDETAARLIVELNDFIKAFKAQKKEALQLKIQEGLSQLMHKPDFIKRVEVVIEGDIIDIEFYDINDLNISKDGLSKGEQQLYATALLKALVEESNIKFPIFIDSPLQKFDKKHARNIVESFYPQISEQVVLFPILEKELSDTEYKWLLPRTSRTFLIENENHNKSTFNEVMPSELFLGSLKVQANVQ